MPETGYPPDGAEVTLIYLTFWDKVAIATGAVGFLLIVALCMVCILCPDCLLHSICCDDEEQDRERTKRKKTNGSRKSTSSYGSVESEYMYGRPEGYEPVPVKWKPMEILKEQDAGASDWSSDAGSSHDTLQLEQLKNRINTSTNGIPNGDTQITETQPPLADGTIQYSLEYSTSEKKLKIKVLEVQELVAHDGRELVSPYVKIRLYQTPKHFFKFRGNSIKDQAFNYMENELKTKMQRPGKLLSYKESFEIPIERDTVSKYVVKFILSDMDKFSRHVILGETLAILRKLDLSSEVILKGKLEMPTEENLGSISLGLSYLPTSEKMYLHVESASGLNVMDRKTGSTDSCVKAYLMYDGKQLKRVKTTVRAMDLNPVFNESFSFDVPQNDLGHVYLSLVVCHYNAEKKSTKVIGRVYLGMIFDADSRDHWISMMCNPRKKIVSTYKILS